MGQIERIPDVLIHEFLTGASVTGVEPAGAPVVDSGETLLRGRYRMYSDLTDGGRISIDVASHGFRIQNVLISTPGITAVLFYITNRDGDDVSAGTATVTGGNAYNEWRNGGILVPPGCKFKVGGTGTLSGAGRIQFHLGTGWMGSSFDDAPVLGKDNRPPGPVRT